MPAAVTRWSRRPYALDRAGHGIRARLLMIDRAEAAGRGTAGIPDQRHRLVDVVLGQAVDDDGGSAAGHRQRHAATDALGSAGDQRDLALVDAFRSVHGLPFMNVCCIQPSPAQLRPQHLLGEPFADQALHVRARVQVVGERHPLCVGRAVQAQPVEVVEVADRPRRALRRSRRAPRGWRCERELARRRPRLRCRRRSTTRTVESDPASVGPAASFDRLAVDRRDHERAASTDARRGSCRGIRPPPAGTRASASCRRSRR